jgi:hypothetical protein
MAYAELGALKGRAGRLSAAWSENSTPSDADLEEYLEQVSGLIDSSLAGIGITVPVENEGAMKALEGLVVDGALILAIEATWPGGIGGPPGVSELLSGARMRFYGLDGRSPNVQIVVPLIETEATYLPGASDLWTDEGIDGDSAIPNEVLSIGRSMRL